MVLTVLYYAAALFGLRSPVFGLLFFIHIVFFSSGGEVEVKASFARTLELLKIFAICAVFAKIVNTESRMEFYVRVVVISFGLLALWGFQQSLLGNERLDTLWPGGSNYIASQ